MTLSRILIANRGEIALRIVRTARDLGATSILPYTPEDLMSPAAELADEAYALPEGSSYTDAAAVLELARATGADAIHPGYGFLSEDADFARSIIEAGITWVGPSPDAMDALGDKMSARATAERAEVAPVPGRGKQEFARGDSDVIDGLQQTAGGLHEPIMHARGQAGSRGLLEKLLVAALQSAVAG